LLDIILPIAVHRMLFENNVTLSFTASVNTVLTYRPVNIQVITT
jgi:hypothetical protein